MADNPNNPATPPANNPLANNPPANPPANPAPPVNNPPPANPPANPPAGDGNKPPANPPANTPPADGNGDGNKPADTGKPVADPGDLYDQLKGDDEKNAEAAAQAKADLAAYLKDAGFEGEISDLKLGSAENGTEATIPAADVASILGALHYAKVPAAQAKGVLATVAALDHIRAARQESEDNAAIAELQEATRQEFGDNLRQALGDTQAAGLALFGAELWDEIRTIKALTNDKRFIRAMSAYGRSRRNDNGGPAPGPGAAGAGEMSFDMNAFWKGTGPR